MEIERLDKYEVYAAQYNQHLRDGDLGSCAKDLHLMAAVLKKEGRRRDELKALMLSFYFDLSGVGSDPSVNRDTADSALRAVSALKIRLYEIEELYLDTVRRDTVPRPIMSARDSLCIFEMCLEGRFDEAEEAVGRFTDL